MQSCFFSSLIPPNNLSLLYKHHFFCLNKIACLQTVKINATCQQISCIATAVPVYRMVPRMLPLIQQCLNFPSGYIIKNDLHIRSMWRIKRLLCLRKIGGSRASLSCFQHVFRMITINPIPGIIE